MLQDKIKARAPRACMTALFAVGFSAMAMTIPLSSAFALSSFQTARHVYPWAQQMPEGTTPGYYAYYRGPAYEHRSERKVHHSEQGW